MSPEKQRRQAMEQAKHILQTEGMLVAVEALLAVCRDPKAPAPAKATAGTSILRACGFFDQKNNEPDKDLSQMSWEELSEYRNRLENEKQALLDGSDAGDQDQDQDRDQDRDEERDVFG